MAAWLVWLVIAVGLGVAETATLTAVLGLLAGAALLTAGVAAIGLPVGLQLLVFAATATVGVLIIRPVAQRHALGTRLERFGVDALIGCNAHTLTEVTARTGIVRIGGEDWTARTFDQSVVIPPGATVNVMQIDGATAIVYPQE